MTPPDESQKSSPPAPGPEGENALSNAAPRRRLAPPPQGKGPGAASLFRSPEEDAPLQQGWGTRVPEETHASLAAFASAPTGNRSGFAELLFRDAIKGTLADPAPRAGSCNAAPGLGESHRRSHETPPAARRVEQWRFSDGRRRLPASVATALHCAILFAVLAVLALGIQHLTSEEHRVGWGILIHEWLEPGRAWLDKDKADPGPATLPPFGSVDQSAASPLPGTLR